MVSNQNNNVRIVPCFLTNGLVSIRQKLIAVADEQATEGVRCFTIQIEQ